MLPLSPPRAPCPPAYPTRAGLLGDASLRRQVLGALAVAALAGCAGEGVPESQPLGGVQQPEPQPQRLAGEVMAPQPITPAPVAPEPQPLGGKPAPVPAPEPQRMPGAPPPPAR